MALIKCPECGKEISDKSKACIHCGYPLENHVDDLNCIIAVDNIQFNTKELSLFVNGERIDLSVDERIILEALLSNRNKVFQREELKYILAGCGRDCDLRSVDVIIRHLREKIEPSPSSPKYIITKWGVGYYFAGENPVSESYKNFINQPIRCPRCKSTQVVTGSRGFSFVTGFLGSGETVNRCGKCGYKWKPKM